MKQIHILLLLFMLFLIGLYWFRDPYLRIEKKLFPKVALLINPQRPDPDMLKKNVYTGLFALLAPSDIDYMDAGARLILSNYDRLLFRKNNPLATPPDFQSIENFFQGKAPLQLIQKISDKQAIYRPPCFNVFNHYCFQETLQQKSIIETFWASNQIIAKRYDEVMSLPNYQAYVYDYTFEPVVPLQSPLFLSTLNLSRSILEFNERRNDEGFSLLEKERQVIRRFFEAENTIVEEMVAIRLYYVFNHTLSVLMDEGLMSVNDPRLLSLLAPLSTNEQKGWHKSIAFERLAMMPSMYYLHREFEVVRDSPHLLAKEERIPEAELPVIDLVATTNLEFLLNQKFIKYLSQTLEEAADQQANNPGFSIERDMQVLFNNRKIAYEKYFGTERNKDGFLFLDSVITHWEIWYDYPLRFYDAQIYQHLIQLKYHLKKNKIPAHEVVRFIQDSGTIGLNPYTKQPILWDEEQTVLKTPRLSRQSAIFNHNPFMEVKVSF